MASIKVAGLDLSAKENRCSGYSVIDVVSKTILDVECLYNDSEILNNVLKDKIKVLAIDSPLMAKPSMRMVDRKALSLGFKVFPPSFKYMRDLTLRAWKLYRILSGQGIEVIETHPRSAIINSGLRDLEDLVARVGLKISNSIDLDQIYGKKDLIDAIVSSIVAYCFYLKLCIDVIEDVDGKIYLISNMGS